MTACGIVILVWEVLAFVFNKKQALVSTWFQKLGFRSPATVFVLGALAGHFWMYFPPTIDDEAMKCPQCNSNLTLHVDQQTGTITATVAAAPE